ncbi:MAG: PEP-CTERM sorting domain-containing protein [Verrucomicrobia bacterium]|nr:PEP-CTERM sorting domain-containing protein [Verrucomicrobiota bacterium]
MRSFGACPVLSRVAFFAGRMTWAGLVPVRGFSILLVGLALTTLPAKGTSIFTESFNYSVGANLDGQNGGSGFSGAWTGGNSTIVGGIGGAGTSALQVGTESKRTLLSTFNTDGNSFYLSYIMNASNFSGGNYTGISLWQGNTESIFLGIPWNAQKFGFDPHKGLPIQSIDFNPLTNTSYLVTLALLPSATSGKVDIKLWATSNLNIDATTLLSAAPNASLIGTRDNFTFDNLRVNGNYAGALKLSGLSSATTGAETISTSVASVPEPSALSLFVVGLGGVIVLRRVRRRTD